MSFLSILDSHIFHILASRAQSDPFLIKFAIFIANKLIYILPLHLVLLWLSRDFEKRKQALTIFFSVVLGVLVSFIIGLLYYRARPFVAGLSLDFLPHKPNASFPSDHGLIFGAYVYLLAHFSRYKMFCLALIFAILTGWARIVVGIHYPFDILGGFIIGVFVAYIFEKYFSRWIPNFLYNIFFSCKRDKRY